MMAKMGEVIQGRQGDICTGWAANASHASRQHWGAESHFSRADRTGTERRSEEGDTVLAPSLFSSALPTACNYFISSFIPWLIAHLLRYIISSGRVCSSTVFPGIPRLQLKVQHREGVQQTFAEEMSWGMNK